MGVSKTEYACTFLNSDEEIKALNKSIDKYNLMVPMINAQMFQFNVIKESRRVYKDVMSEIEGDNDPFVIAEKLFASERKTGADESSTTLKPEKAFNFSSSPKKNDRSSSVSVWQYIINEFRTYLDRNKTKGA